MTISKSTKCPKNDKPPREHMVSYKKMADQIRDSVRTTSEAVGFSSTTVKRRCTLADDTFGSLSCMAIRLSFRRSRSAKRLWNAPILLHVPVELTLYHADNHCRYP